MNGIHTFVDLNIIPLNSYDVLNGIDWLGTYHTMLDCHNKTLTCLGKEGKHKIVKDIPRPFSTRHVSIIQLKICFRKGCQLCVDRGGTRKRLDLNLEYFPILLYANVFTKIH